MHNVAVPEKQDCTLENKRFSEKLPETILKGFLVLTLYNIWGILFIVGVLIYNFIAFSKKNGLKKQRKDGRYTPSILFRPVLRWNQ